MPFPPHPVRVCALNTTPHRGCALSHLAEVCLSGVSAEEFLSLPFPSCSLCGDVTTCSPHLRGGLGSLPEGTAIYIYNLECFHTDLSLLPVYLFSIFSYQYGPMSVYFILWSVLQHYVTHSVAPSIPAFVAPPWLLWPFNTPSLQALFVLSTAFLSGTIRS